MEFEPVFVTAIAIITLLYAGYIIIRSHKLEYLLKDFPEKTDLSENDREKDPQEIMMTMIFSFKPLKLKSWFDQETIANVRKRQKGENEFN